MKPTDEQITNCVTRYLATFPKRKAIEEVLTYYESIRQPDDRQLIRTNHELAQQLAGVQKELAELKALLPEWIPVGERLPTRDDEDAFNIAWLSVDGEIQISRFFSCADSPEHWTHWTRTSALAALPKRQTAPKATPEEIEAQEQWSAWLDYSRSHPGEGGRMAFDWAWQAAKKGLTTP